MTMTLTNIRQRLCTGCGWQAPQRPNEFGRLIARVTADAAPGDPRPAASVLILRRPELAGIGQGPGMVAAVAENA